MAQKATLWAAFAFQATVNLAIAAGAQRIARADPPPLPALRASQGGWRLPPHRAFGWCGNPIIYVTEARAPFLLHQPWHRRGFVQLDLAERCLVREGLEGQADAGRAVEQMSR